MRIAFLVTHLLGTGHLARTGQIADAFARAGHETLVLSGGMPAALAAPKTARLQQLPAIRSDASFTSLYGETDVIAPPSLFDRRIDEIRNAIKAFAPDVLVTELFPFGRRKLATEFTTAIDAAPNAQVFASIRDILQMPRKAGRKEEAEARLQNHYDGILFHGDTTLVGLDASWPLTKPLASKIHETGYIASSTPVQNDDGTDGTGEIIVAAGGGAVGDRLFSAALAAARVDPTRRWRILVGKSRAIETTPPNTIVEPVRPDFRALLSRSNAAILQCGYNTAMDVAVTGARAVFCPFEGDGETEQLQRARAMAQRYGCGIIREDALNPERLLAAIEEVHARPRPDFSALRLDGAQRCVEIIEGAMRP